MKWLFNFSVYTQDGATNKWSKFHTIFNRKKVVYRYLICKERNVEISNEENELRKYTGQDVIKRQVSFKI